MMKNNILEISRYLDYLFPNPQCELNYKNDYELLIAIMLSAQSTDKRVNSVTDELFKKYDSLEKLNRVSVGELESIIRSVGSFRKKSLYIKGIVDRLINEFNGVVPTDREILETFPGVGRKTVNVFLSEFYNYPAIAVDTHVDRVSKRLGLAYKNDNVIKIEQKLMKKFKKESWAKVHLQLVLFGRYYCKAVKPMCNSCHLRDICREKKKNID